MAEKVKIRKFGQLSFWAENGLIHLNNEETGKYVCLSRLEALTRAQALSEEAAHRRGDKYYDQRNAMVELVEDIIEVVREAKHQGDPHDPKVLEHYAKHRPPQGVSMSNLQAGWLFTPKSDVRNIAILGSDGQAATN